MLPDRRDLLGPAILALVTFVVFSSALGNAFLNWDDVFFLHHNRAVLGFDLPALLSQRVVGIYHPVTMLSLALEHAIFGLDPFWFHLDNVLLHALNAVLVVLLVRRLCPRHPVVPLLCGAFFAFHPLRAESVAWVAERKDLLSTCFFLATLLAFLRFRDGGRSRWYAASLALYALAVFSKPMAVTAPLVMAISEWRLGRRGVRPLSWQLLPFLGLALVVGVLSFVTQAHHPAERLAIYELGPVGRLEIAIQSLVFYVSKTVLPLRLSAYYDVEAVQIEPYRYALAAAVLGWMAYAAFRPGPARGNYRWALLFFMVTVAPVLKLVPFGGNSLFNDRYTYLPGIGLSFALALPFRDVWSWPRLRRGAALAGLAALVAALAVASHERAKVWRTSETFWLDVLRKYPETPLALNNLGRFYLDQVGDVVSAHRAFEAAVRMRPEYASAHFNLGLVDERLGNRDAAARHFERALALAPYSFDFQVRVGLFFQHNGDPQRAIEHYRAAMALDPAASLPHHNLGVLYQELGQLDPARASFERAIERSPELGPSRAGLAEVLLLQGQLRRALESYEAALALGAEVDPETLARLRRQVDRDSPRL